MKSVGGRHCRRLLVLLLCAGFLAAERGGAAEVVTTAAQVVDGVLYVASAERPGHAGHLRAFDITGDWPVLLWDAARQVPRAGVGDHPGSLFDSDPPAWPGLDNLYRTIWTNLPGAAPGELVPFAPPQVERLHAPLAAAGNAEATALINRVRGRLGANAEHPAGRGEDPCRLWGISRSTPVLVGASPMFSAASGRDRVIYAGAEDGMLHAFFAGARESAGAPYQNDAPGGGRELWAFLPGSLLSHLKGQPFDELAAEAQVHLDGPAAVGDYFIAGDPDEARSWQTLLVASATITAQRQSLVFALNVSDPYRPQLLWEQPLPGENLGQSRGVTIGSRPTITGPQPRAYLTASFALPSDGAHGVHALALDLASGRPLWQFSRVYEEAATAVASPPASPALLDVDDDGWSDFLVFGDLAGRLWVLDARDGSAPAGGPAFRVESGAAEPIGAAVAVFGRRVVFGTGGAEHAAADGRYAVYAVEIDVAGQARLVWTHRLEPGERVWAAPSFDAQGNLILGVADLSPAEAAAGGGHGRLLVLDAHGREQESLALSGPVFGRVALAEGVAVAVSASGEVSQLGRARRSEPRDDLPAGPLRLFSWRLR